MIAKERWKCLQQVESVRSDMEWWQDRAFVLSDLLDASTFERDKLARRLKWIEPFEREGRLVVEGRP